MLAISLSLWQVPDYWKTYAHEVDQEREMWLNSFYKAPLRLPMPAELEYWWENGMNLFFFSNLHVSVPCLTLRTNDTHADFQYMPYCKWF